ncbi:MAG: Integrin-like protein [Verrucomicrobiales bacterium]|nr:Integrin-like protein [Verrucomicrobiales bacterium]
MKNLSCLAIISVGFAVNLSAATVTPATGGNISADKSANSPNAAWTTLGTITLTEVSNGDLAAGTNKTLIVKVPTGFQFNSAAAPAIAFTTKKDISAATIGITSNTITATITVKGVANQDSLTIKSVQIRPLVGTPLAAPGNIYRPTSTNGGTATIAGITATANTDGSGGTSFCALTEIGGTPRKLAFATNPAGAVLATVFTTQPVIRTQDQFGNYSTNGLAATVTVVTSLNTGTGPLLGTRTNNIGTAGAKGTLTHTNLQITTVAGTNYQLKAVATGFTNGLSAMFAVTKKTPSITWSNPVAITYGTALSSLQLNATSSVAGAFTYSPVSGTVLNAGTNQTLSVNFVPTDTTNYVTNAASVAINVTKPTLSVVVSNATRPYGLANPTFTGSISGKVNSDNITATYGCAATATNAAGTYPIVPTLADPGSRLGNYVLSVTNGTLVIQPPAIPTVTAQRLTNKHVLIQLSGATNPVYTIQAANALGAAWTNIGDALMISNKLTLDDTNAVTRSNRFYRAIVK